MAIKELFQDSRPQVLFDPRASQRIDPRFKFTRNGAATFYGSDGLIRYAGANQPRIDHDPSTGVSIGLMLEATGRNWASYSEDFTFWTPISASVSSAAITAPDRSANATVLTDNTSDAAHYIRLTTTITSSLPTATSVFVKRGTSRYFFIGRQTTTPKRFVTFDFDNPTEFAFASGSTTNATSASLVQVGDGWYRASIYESTGVGGATNKYFYIGLADAPVSGSATISDFSYQGTGSGSIYIWGAQIELSTYPTSYIPTAGSTVTRAADLLSIEGTSLPSTGSIYIDARSLTSDVDNTLLSAANASDDKLTLAIRQPASLYNSKALVYEVDGAFKPTLPFPVPSNEQERNLITYGANNYHYRSDSARLTPSSSTSVPANMTRLGIGHDVTDPTKAIAGYINTVYLWPGEITPTVAEALVRGDVDPKDADAGVFTPEAGALAFVFNTQGTGTSGDRVVELPVSGSTNNILVDWGDNTSSSFIGAAASSTVSHTYSAPGIYPVQITADDDGTNSGLQTLTFYNSSQRLDLVRVLQWGGSTTWNPTTMYRAFRDCTQLDFEPGARTNPPGTSAVTNWQEAFYSCSSISGTFPTFDTSAATDFRSTWFGCSSLTAFPFINPSNVTIFSNTWQNCTSLTSFPLINTTAGTNFSSAWRNCTSLASFPLINTAAGTSFSNTWQDCTSLTSFPLIDTSSGTSFSSAWEDCTSLTTFPLINTAAGTNFSSAWEGCTSLTSFPAINASSGTNFEDTWRGCSSLTTFPLIDTSNGTNFVGTWRGCSSLTSFPLIDTSSGTSFTFAWLDCSSLTSFPLIDTSSGTTFGAAWEGCFSLTSFPQINTAAATSFNSAWRGCSSLTSFPLINSALVANFTEAWYNCSSLTSFPLISSSSGTDFYRAWYGCSSLTDFPASFFDSWVGTPETSCFVGTWLNCSSLTATSVENILNSIDTSGQSAPASGVDITIDYNAGSGTPSISTAVTNLKGRGWTITLNGVAQ